MGKSTRAGFRARETSIQIYFWYNGERCYEKLELPPTPKNLKYADALAKEISRKLELGVFNITEYFADSKYAGKRDEKKTNLLFSNIADAWLASKQRGLAETTLKEYRNTVDTYFTGSFGAQAMSEISFLDIDQLMSGLNISNKTFNNVLSVLRGIYKYGINAKACTENHAAKLEFTKKQEPNPDPLSQDQMELVLEDMRKHYEEQIEIYFFLAFRLGFRPSEGIELRWSKLDETKKELEISTAKVRFIEKDTKTGKSRIVELDDECMAAIQRLKKHTYMKGDHLFIYPETGRPYSDTSYLVQRYWRPSLKRCKIRDRDARQTRHTCATLMLMAGCEPAWSARQLGHSVEMFLRVYSKWMPENDQRKQLSKMSAMLKQNTKLTGGLSQN